MSYITYSKDVFATENSNSLMLGRYSSDKSNLLIRSEAKQLASVAKFAGSRKAAIK